MSSTENETPTAKAVENAAATPAERVAAEIGTEVGRQMGEAMGAAAGQAAARIAEETVDQVKREATQRVQDVKARTLGPVHDVTEQVSELTRLRPLVAVGFAVGIGYVLGSAL